MEYRVKWVIDLDAETPRDAARLALEIMRDPESTIFAFIVDDQIIDLAEEQEDDLVDSDH